MRFGCWIHGESVTGNDRSAVVDPATEECFAEVPVCDAALVDRAVASASEALTAWRREPTVKRVACLRRLSQKILEYAEELTALVVREVGKPAAAARSEVENAAELVGYFAEEALRLSGEIPCLNVPKEQVLILREPVGVVAAVTPFNYPLSTLACKISPALGVGCTVVAKPDEHTPLATLKVAQLASEAGLPPGAFNVVTGFGPQTGRLLVGHPAPRLVAFTGSSEVGKEIQKNGADHVKRLILELGGHCPAILCADAPWRSVVPQMISQAFKNSGQYCYRISRIYVDRRIAAEFTEAFVKAASALKVGPPGDPATQLGPLNNPDVLETVRRQVEAAVNSGATLLLGGRRLETLSPGYYFPPTVITGTHPGMEVTKAEVFGPVVVIEPFDDLDEAIRMANATPYGLAAYLFTADLGKALERAGELEVGSLWINRIHQALPFAPFGGVKESGLGREKSRFGVQEYTELKTIYLSY